MRRSIFRFIPSGGLKYLPHTDGIRLTPVVIDGDEVTVGVNGIGCVS